MKEQLKLTRLRPSRYLNVAGSLMGDASFFLPGLREMCQKYDIMVICGVYQHELFRWAREEIEGMTYEIADGLVYDADELIDNGARVNPLAPGIGYPAMILAEAQARAGLKDRLFLSLVEGTDPNAVLQSPPIRKETLWSVWTVVANNHRPFGPDAPYLLPLRRLVVHDGAHVAVHAYTKHDWKNLDGLLTRVSYRRSPVSLGLPSESQVGEQPVRPFAAQVECVLTAHCVVGVQSFWSCLAALFGKRQIVASFSGDANLDLSRINPRCRHLVLPTLEELQRMINEEGC